MVVDLIYDEILMVNLLVLQAWHGLSDPELGRQVADRISFMKFLGFPETENALFQLRSKTIHHPPKKTRDLSNAIKKIRENRQKNVKPI